MFRNGSRQDEGDLARPGAATITGRTILEVFLVPAHGCGRYKRPIWAHQCKLMWVLLNKIIQHMNSIKENGQ